MVCNDKELTVGSPFVKGAMVRAQILRQPFGNYEILVELFNGPDGLGNKVGEIRAPIQIGSITSSFQTIVGAIPRQLKLSASPSLITAGESTQLYAVGLTGSGTPTFLQPGQVTWTSINDITQINAQGIAFNQNPGTGSN